MFQPFSLKEGVNAQFAQIKVISYKRNPNILSAVFQSIPFCQDDLFCVQFVTIVSKNWTLSDL